MSTLFFTDPHLGLPRTANTTPTSSAALQQALFTQAELALVYVSGADKIVCLGDMFDRFSNPEQAQKQGLQIAIHCDLILSGNHDVVNQQNKFGSLQMVSYAIDSLLNPTPVVFAPFGHPHVHPQYLEDDLFSVSVPHVASQTLFEQSLGMALDEGEGCGHQGTKALLLHCNYNLSESFATETSLNLLDEHVEELLKVFDYILMGHEHGPAEHYDGRLIILGNTHPTGFADISDKRVAIYEDGAFRFETIWEEAKGYAEIDCHEIPRTTLAQFVRIVGEAGEAGVLDIMKQVSRLWEKSPSLYAVKVDLTQPGITNVDGQSVRRSLAQLPDLIRKELSSDKPLLEMWDTLAAEERE